MNDSDTSSNWSRPTSPAPSGYATPDVANIDIAITIEGRDIEEFKKELDELYSDYHAPIEIEVNEIYPCWLIDRCLTWTEGFQHLTTYFLFNADHWLSVIEAYLNNRDVSPDIFKLACEKAPITHRLWVACLQQSLGRDPFSGNKDARETLRILFDLPFTFDPADQLYYRDADLIAILLFKVKEWTPLAESTLLLLQHRGFPPLHRYLVEFQPVSRKNTLCQSVGRYELHRLHVRSTLAPKWRDARFDTLSHSLRSLFRQLPNLPPATLPYLFELCGIPPHPPDQLRVR